MKPYPPKPGQSLAEMFPEVAAEWHPSKNGDLTPQDVSYGSATSVWWMRACRPGEAPHEWHASLNSRTRSPSGCAVCRGLQIQIGVNDLGSIHPAIAAEWHPTLNAEVTPADVSIGSKKKAWWRCSSCSNEWSAPIQRRTLQGSGCPMCRRQGADAKRAIASPTNSVAHTHPDLLSEWHPDRNEGLDPSTINRASHRVVWWRCHAGHEWKTAVSKRTASGRGCPICANQQVLAGFNDLGTTHPDIAAEWHPSKNGDREPTGVLGGSPKKAWWLGKCGHEWDAAISSRTKGIGCPVCYGRRVLKGFNDLASQVPELASEWHPTKNAPLTPDMVAPQSNKAVWWQCQLGHEWRTSPASRHKSGCAVCAGKRVLAGFNDLETKDPEVAAEWHPTRNGQLKPTAVARFSGRNVWWICSEGHEWRTTVATRSTGSGCPSCMHSGFSSSEPGWVYLITHRDLDLLQIGISNVPEQRLQQHARRGWEPLDIRGPMPGDQARAIELAGFKALSSRGAELGENHSGLKFDGFTEAWPTGSLDLESISQLIEWINDDESTELG